MPFIYPASSRVSALGGLYASGTGGIYGFRDTTGILYSNPALLHSSTSLSFQAFTKIPTALYDIPYLSLGVGQSFLSNRFSLGYSLVYMNHGTLEIRDNEGLYISDSFANSMTKHCIGWAMNHNLPLITINTGVGAYLDALNYFNTPLFHFSMSLGLRVSVWDIFSLGTVLRLFEVPNESHAWGVSLYAEKMLILLEYREKWYFKVPYYLFMVLNSIHYTMEINGYESITTIYNSLSFESADLIPITDDIRLIARMHYNFNPTPVYLGGGIGFHIRKLNRLIVLNAAYRHDFRTSFGAIFFDVSFSLLD